MDNVLAALSGHVEAVFLPRIADRFTVQWLDVNDDRLGMTRFEEGSNELIRRRRLRLDPGEVTIGLHPALLEDEALYRHTFAHELFHAAGLMLHTELHDRLTNEVAPSPGMKDSPAAEDALGGLGHPEGAGVDLQGVRLHVEADDGSPPYALFEACTALVRTFWNENRCTREWAFLDFSL